MRCNKFAKMPPILFFTLHYVHALCHVSLQPLPSEGGSVCWCLESGMACDLLWPGEHRGNQARPVPSLGLKRLRPLLCPLSEPCHTVRKAQASLLDIQSPRAAPDSQLYQPRGRGPLWVGPQRTCSADWDAGGSPPSRAWPTCR